MAVISVAVMAHPNRADFVRELTDALDVSAEVVWDRCSNEWDTGRRALMAFDPQATHHLVVQDDALVCQKLGAAAAQAADVSGDRLVSFYTGQVRPHKHLVERAWAGARAAGATWLQMPGPWWGVALMLPTAHILDLVAWADRRGRHIRDYDKRVARWHTREGVPCWYSVPSLVDHRPEAESPSLLPGHAAHRQAHEFIGRSASGLDVEWQAEAFVPNFRRREV